MSGADAPALRREIRRYRGVPYEHWTYFPEGVETQIRGDHPGLVAAILVASRSIAYGRQWRDWFAECAICGHTARDHARERKRDTGGDGGTCGFVADTWDDLDEWYEAYCECEGHVPRAPLAVAKGALSEPSRVA